MSDVIHARETYSGLSTTTASMRLLVRRGTEQRRCEMKVLKNILRWLTALFSDYGWDDEEVKENGRTILDHDNF